MTVYSLEAKTVIREIIADMLRGQVPLDVRSFTDLHDSVDANEYLIEAGLGYMTDAEIEATNSVEAEVNWWLESLPDRRIETIQSHRPVI